ncbi:hypothetical protein A8H35_23745 [Burkholderia thailandensis]|uniref:Uncharacterized protein n=1 Tax=Burkholderia thailandensis (strain ATCC 700388 / DSM 13276 / CCUG 48851 / CIP 106301 / E264) TaxID=271848 RepID=Q2T2U3_BURTA|nr:hypothetical protein BTH_II2319 [Burkholderia thailandensis E264]AOJ49088.1 hypothetical protein WJ27_29240 [Burkholderia thailandensis]AWY61227.1 hypothetical protein A8H35_23745 [Burkholderia thailandensis]AWY65304.1 hypothetical protein A8H36_08890 [Burkholderia thailandensis]KVG17253.1 hypothetical protein WJ25_21430 [Burkholderia thailandensis]
MRRTPGVRIVLGGTAIHARCFVRRASCFVLRPASGAQCKHAGLRDRPQRACECVVAQTWDGERFG